MEIGTGKPVSRRSALGGMGAAMALPLVSSASPVSSARVGREGLPGHGLGPQSWTRWGARAGPPGRRCRCKRAH